MKFVVGSLSERKIRIVQEVAQELFNDKAIKIEGCNVASGVPETPYDQQTLDGAKNRAINIQKSTVADYYIGVESGLVERYGHIFEEAWAVVYDKNKCEFIGYSSGLKVPEYILRKVNDLKMNHCEVMEIIEKEFDLPNETWGNYSGGMITREVSLMEALRNAFLQIVANDESFYKMK